MSCSPACFSVQACMPEPSPLIATVAVAAPLPKPLSYRVPEAWRDRTVPGARVLVPLGRRVVAGCVLAVETGAGSDLKELSEVAEGDVLFPAEMLPFLLRAADYYRYPPGEAIRSVVPAGLGSGTLRAAPRCERIFTARPGTDLPRGEKQRAIMTLLRSAGPLSSEQLQQHISSLSEPLRRLREQGWIDETRVERLRDPFSASEVAADTPPQLNAEQAAARTRIVTALHSGSFSPFLLHGVTGSGKTEVYLHAIGDALELGKSALILVPEIALTPQLVGRFRARFGQRESIAVLHSGLSDGERFDAWRRIQRGAARIVIGARSAVFAPLPQPGIIVIDEEHDASYKQGEGFRYHARDLALLRGQMCGATVLLGSATPAISTYYRAQTGKCDYLPLPTRVEDRPLPPVELLDLRGAATGALTTPLLEAVRQNHVAGEQTLLLLNRRGFSPYLLCGDCGLTFRCPNCEITLTYHQSRRQLRCHYCDYTQKPPEACPGCGGMRILPEGAGTERLEEELAATLPDARIARMDRDTTARKGAHQALVEQMTDGKIDILVGTQMIAKGHDFPGVTLVGVIDADATLNFPDFRSAERTFALLTQVAGRAGRGERPGRVLIQTRSPQHYAVACAATHDYQGFYEQELAFRRDLDYPPFGYLVNLILAGNDLDRTARGAGLLAQALESHSTAVEILGPAPCPLARLRGKSRFQILLKAPQRPPLQRLLTQLDPLRRTLPPGVALSIDVDPLDML